jgi:molybdopterin molybdotransferase
MADLLPVADAIVRIVSGVTPVAAELVPIADAGGRTLADELTARRTQPPFPASAMDGYAVRAADAVSGARLRVIGMSAAGAGFGGSVGSGEAVRIFTGAPVPNGADAIVIQEDTQVEPPDGVVVRAAVRAGRYVRPAGLDFHEGQALLDAGRRLGPRELALAAAMGYGALHVRCLPRVAILSTGDELVPPGATPESAQIVAASAPGIAALVTAAGGEPHDLGIARDHPAALAAAIDKARSLAADVIVTLGGASVGDHDLVGPVLAERGMELGFWRIAMRPGKPLMFGTLGATRVLGLPGNPVSSLVCALLFLMPLVDALLGRPLRDPSEAAVLAADVAANDTRQDYVRATLAFGSGLPLVTPLPTQDSSQLATLARADCLLIRAPDAPAATAGSACRIIRLP